MALPVTGYSILLPAWLLVPTAAFLVTPMLNDIVFHARPMPKRELLRYLGHSMLLYGSMFFVTLKSAFKSGFGRSVFLVTPKEQTDVSFRSVLAANRGELVFGVGLALLAIALTGQPAARPAPHRPRPGQRLPGDDAQPVIAFGLSAAARRETTSPSSTTRCPRRRGRVRKEAAD